MIVSSTADKQMTNKMVKIIDDYSLASGQRVNYQKSNVHFGKKIPDQRREEIKRKLNINHEGGEGIYLGLPKAFSGSEVTILSYLKERMNQKVMGWQKKFLSPGGKETLLKAVEISLPTYTMFFFKLPKTVCEALTSVMDDFWWRTSRDSRGIHWKAWDKLCLPKGRGGLGFRDIEGFNLALLGKQLWRMITHLKSILARVFKGRYFCKFDPLCIIGIKTLICLEEYSLCSTANESTSKKGYRKWKRSKGMARSVDRQQSSEAYTSSETGTS